MQTLCKMNKDDVFILRLSAYSKLQVIYSRVFIDAKVTVHVLKLIVHAINTIGLIGSEITATYLSSHAYTNNVKVMG